MYKNIVFYILLHFSSTRHLPIMLICYYPPLVELKRHMKITWGIRRKSYTKITRTLSDLPGNYVAFLVLGP